VLAALALFAVMFVVGIYNKLVGLRDRFKNACAQIEVQLKHRYDLIPKLVETGLGSDRSKSLKVRYLTADLIARERKRPGLRLAVAALRRRR